METYPDVTVTPSARRLTSSLRALGHDAPTAIADLVDNSISAGAQTISVLIGSGPEGRPAIRVVDDGCGMTRAQLVEAMRFGTRRTYGPGQLGRFGLGLKTASISMGRRVTVTTRHAPVYRRFHSLTLDLDVIAAADDWRLSEGRGSSAFQDSVGFLHGSSGTVVTIEDLDRLLPNPHSTDGFTRRRLHTLAKHVAEYLSMVFHRFLEDGNADFGSGLPLAIHVNGENLLPWNPFAPELSRHLPPRRFDLPSLGGSPEVVYTPYVLPSFDQFDSPDRFAELAGPKRWNRQQGLYIYRAGRMIQAGGWSGLRGLDEHTKLARASLDIPTCGDDVFQIDVAKMRVQLPEGIRTLLKDEVDDLARQANKAYRSTRRLADSGSPATRPSPGGDSYPEVVHRLLVSAVAAGVYEEFCALFDRLREHDPELFELMGWVPLKHEDAA